MPQKKKSSKSASIRERLARAEPGLDSQLFPLDTEGDAFAYRVAQMAWVEGLTVSAMIRKMGLERTAEMSMAFKRALNRAYRGYLKLNVPLDERRQTDLHKEFNNDNSQDAIAFHVVNDAYGPPLAPVAAKAADLVHEIVHQLQLAAPSKKDIIVCNAGGRTVSEVVKGLQRHPPAADAYPDEAHLNPLLFVGANAAYMPDQFECSANFLSVTMAQLFHARHHALEFVENKVSRARHWELVEDASLVICGVGTRQGMLRELFEQNLLPQEAVGDLAFNLVDKHGRKVEITNEETKAYLDRVNPSLDLNTLEKILRHRKRVLLVLGADVPEVKAEIATAVLRRRYATDVVLGSRLAYRILKDAGVTPS